MCACVVYAYVHVCMCACMRVCVCARALCVCMCVAAAADLSHPKPSRPRPVEPGAPRLDGGDVDAAEHARGGVAGRQEHVAAILHPAVPRKKSLEGVGIGAREIIAEHTVLAVVGVGQREWDARYISIGGEIGYSLLYIYDLFR